MSITSLARLVLLASGFAIALATEQAVVSQTMAPNFKVIVTVTSDKGVPVDNAGIYLANTEKFSDIEFKRTDGNGRAELTGKYGGVYEMTVSRECFKRFETRITIDKYGDQKVFEEAVVLKQTCYALTPRPSPNSFKREVLITVRGKDNEGNVAPLKGALVDTPDGPLVTGPDGTARYKHGFKPTEMIYFAAFAEGYVTRQESVMVGSKAVYEPDTVEFLLPAVPYETVPLEVLVLDWESKKPVTMALVTIQLLKPVKVDGQTKTIWSSEHSDANGYARFTDATGKSIPVELATSNEFRAVVAKEGFAEAWSDISSELLVPSKQPRVFTVWIKPEKSVSTNAPGWKLESVTPNPVKRYGEAVTDIEVTKNSFAGRLRESRFTVSIDDLPDFIRDGEKYTVNVRLGFEGTDERSFLTFSFQEEGGITEDPDSISPYAATKSKASTSGKYIFADSSPTWRSKGDRAVIRAKIYIEGAPNDGYYFLEARYVRTGP